MIRKLFSFFFQRIRGNSYSLSKDIPISYLCILATEKLIDRIYGAFRLFTIKSVYISPSSTIKCKSKIVFGKDLIIGPGCYIDALGYEGIKCGEKVSFGRETTMVVTGSLQNIGKGIEIGDNVGLGTRGHYGGAGGLKIESDTIIGNYVSFHPENHNFSNLDQPIRLQGVNHKGITIGKGCWIGAKATILDGTRIGDGCIVAAGAVVTGVFPDNVIIGESQPKL